MTRATSVRPLCRHMKGAAAASLTATATHIDIMMRVMRFPTVAEILGHVLDDEYTTMCFSVGQRALSK